METAAVLSSEFTSSHATTISNSSSSSSSSSVAGREPEHDREADGVSNRRHQQEPQNQKEHHNNHHHQQQQEQQEGGQSVLAEARPQIKLEGYLAKRSVKPGRTWRRRYFVLEDTVLRYYRSPRDSKPRGEIVITSNTFVKRSQLRAFSLELATNRQVLVISAEFQSTQQDWLDALLQSIELARVHKYRGMSSVSATTKLAAASAMPSDASAMSLPSTSTSSTSSSLSTSSSSHMQVQKLQQPIESHLTAESSSLAAQQAAAVVKDATLPFDENPKAQAKEKSASLSNSGSVGNVGIKDFPSSPSVLSTREDVRDGSPESTKKIESGSTSAARIGESELPEYLLKRDENSDEENVTVDSDNVRGPDSRGRSIQEEEEKTSCGMPPMQEAESQAQAQAQAQAQTQAQTQAQAQGQSQAARPSGPTTGSANAGVGSTSGFGRASNLFRRFTSRRRGSSTHSTTSDAAPKKSEAPSEPVATAAKSANASASLSRSESDDPSGRAVPDAVSDDDVHLENTENGESQAKAVKTEEVAPESGAAPAATEQQAASPGEASAMRPRPTHKFVSMGTPFEVDTRYSYIKAAGSGAFGMVVSAHDRLTGDKVAIKKVPHAFEDLVDAKRILREVKLLRHFDHENVINIRDLMTPESYDYDDIYIVSELMETDLHRVIYSKQTLTDDHIQYFVYQTLRALKYIHSADVIHRDLKPSNLLLNSNCDLKICDLGLARGLKDNDLGLTEYVVTRWYRAPEIMLACREYTKAIDMWAVGCILAELLARKPLFPGGDYIEQLQLMTDVLGTPPESDMHFIRSETAKRFMRSQQLRPKRKYAKMFPKASEKSLDLLDKMLQFNPDKRISVEDALAHPYLATLYQPNDEPVCPEPFIFDDNKADDELRKREIQDQILQEVLLFHPEDAPRLIAAQQAVNPDAAYPLQQGGV